MVAGGATAASYSDADGDGKIEVGEEISFHGDEFYFDEQGYQHDYNNWWWDFDNDGNWDVWGIDQIYVFDEEGVYTVTLVQSNGDMEIVVFSIDVVVGDEEPEEPEGREHRCMKWKLIKRLANRNVKLKHEIRWLLKYAKHIQKGKCDCDHDY